MNDDRVEKTAQAIKADVVRLRTRFISAESGSEDQDLRLLEALLFAAVEPIDIETLRERMPEKTDVNSLLAQLSRNYQARGVNLVRVGGGWRFQTAPDLERHLVDIRPVPRKLSKAALETLAIIAYHQPVTRAEVEDIRGVSVSKGTLDVLMELNWVRLRGRRRTPGRPLTYGTTDQFLAHFNLTDISDLPGQKDLKAAGLLDARLPENFMMPTPMMVDHLGEDEEPLEDTSQAANFFEDFLSEDEEDKSTEL